MGMDTNTGDLFNTNQCSDPKMELVTDETFETVLRKIRVSNTLVVDTETTGLDPFNGDTICGVGVALSETESYYFPFYHAIPQYDENNKLIEKDISHPWPGQVDDYNFKYNQLVDVLFSKGKTLVFHNAKFDIFQLIKSYFVPWDRDTEKDHTDLLNTVLNNCTIVDTLIAARILWSDTTLPFDTMKKLKLKQLCDFFWPGSSLEEQKILKLMQSRKHTRKYNFLSPKELYKYCCMDCILTFKLFNKELAEVFDRGVEKLLEQELRLLKVITRMEWFGVRYDVKECDNFINICEILKGHLQDKMDNLLSFHIEPTKAKDIIAAFDYLGISLKDITKVAPGVAKSNAKKVRNDKTPTEISTDKEVLLLTNHELGKWIIDWKKCANLESTFLVGVKNRLDKNGIVHTNFHQAGAHTGRFSSYNPNLQNLPRGKDEDEPFEIISDLGETIRRRGAIMNPRKLFIPREDNMILVKMDYSQVEYRMLAYYSKDPNMIAAFNAGMDLHQATCDKINDVLGAGTVTRKHAKNINFGMIYGLGVAGLAGMLFKPQDEVRDILYAYHRSYPRIRQFTDKVRRVAQQRGYVFNLYGRRYGVPKNLEYKLVNYLIQGTCADMLKEKMIDIQNYFDENQIPIKMIMTIHDEIVFELEPVKEILMELGTVKKMMENFNEPIDGLRPEITTIPILADVDICPNNLFETEELAA